MQAIKATKRPDGSLQRVMLAVAGSVVAAMLATAIFASSADAAYTSQHPSDGSWATSDHHAYAVCDASADGHKAYAHVWQHYTPEPFTTGYDTYGRDSHGRFCHHSQVAFYEIRAIQVCVQYEGCGPWKGVGYPRLTRAW
jgi:hypothetical protein